MFHVLVWNTLNFFDTIIPNKYVFAQLIQFNRWTRFFLRHDWNVCHSMLISNFSKKFCIRYFIRTQFIIIFYLSLNRRAAVVLLSSKQIVSKYTGFRYQFYWQNLFIMIFNLSICILTQIFSIYMQVFLKYNYIMIIYHINLLFIVHSNI